MALEIFTADEIPYDSVQIELGQAPLTSVHVSESVDWSQAATGTIDFGQRWFQTCYSRIHSKFMAQDRRTIGRRLECRCRDMP